MMIPGAWEARRRSASPVDVVDVVRVARVLEPVTSAPQRAELSGWLKVSIFVGTLLTAMWLAMAVFFD
jgi:hypothetical protein